MAIIPKIYIFLALSYLANKLNLSNLEEVVWVTVEYTHLRFYIDYFYSPAVKWEGIWGMAQDVPQIHRPLPLQGEKGEPRSLPLPHPLGASHGRS